MAAQPHPLDQGVQQITQAFQTIANFQFANMPAIASNQNVLQAIQNLDNHLTGIDNRMDNIITEMRAM